MEQRLSRLEETYERGFSRLEETYERGFSRLEEMIAELCERRGLLMRRIDGDEEQYPVKDYETDLLGTRMIVDPNLENQEDWEQIVILEEESIPQSKVPFANSEILKSIEPGKVDLGLEKLEHVVMNENLEQEWDQKNLKETTDVDGEVERGQKVISNTKICCAHKVFGKMSHYQELGIKKKRKGFKSWMFKYRRGNKKLHALTFPKNMRLAVSQHLRMDETSSDLLLLNGKENEGCFNGSQALVLMEGITESSSRAEELMKEEPDFVKVNEVKMEKQIVDREMSPTFANLETVTKGMIGSHVVIAFVFKQPAIPYSPYVEHNLFATMLLRVQSKKKQRKGPKSWKFKFKSENLRKMEVKSVLDNREAVVSVIGEVLFQHSHGLSNRLHRQDLQDLQQFITFGEVTFPIEHKWKFKGKGREVREELSHTSRATIQEGPSHYFLLVAAAYLTIPMQFGSEGNHVWHRWKARYSQNFDRVWDPGVSSFFITLRSRFLEGEGFDIGNGLRRVAREKETS